MPASIPKGARERWALYAGTVVCYGDMYVTQPLLPDLSREFGVGPAQAGLTVSAVVLAIALASILYGPLSDALGRRAVMVASLALLALATLACALPRSFGALVAVRGVQGLLVPGMSAVSVAYAGTVVLFALATKLTTAANAIFIQDMAPLWVLLLSPWLLRELPTRGELLAVPVYGLGLALFFLDDLSAGQKAGNLVALLSGVAFAFSIVGLRKVHAAGTAVIAWGNLLAFAVALLAALFVAWWLLTMGAGPIGVQLVVLRVMPPEGQLRSSSSSRRSLSDAGFCWACARDRPGRWLVPARRARLPDVPGPSLDHRPVPVLPVRAVRPERHARRATGDSLLPRRATGAIDRRSSGYGHAGHPRTGPRRSRSTGSR